MVTFTLMDVIYFSIVFVYLDDTTAATAKDTSGAEPWLACLVMSGGDKTKCFKYGQAWLVNEATISAVLLMLGLIGIVTLTLTFRSSFFPGWRDTMSSLFGRKQEFVSLDAMYPPESQNWSSQKAQQYYQQQQYNSTNKGAMFEMQRPVHSQQQQQQKDYGDFADSTTIGSAHLQTPLDSYSPPSQYADQHQQWGRLSPSANAGRQTPDAILHRDPYQASTDRGSPTSASHPSLNPYIHPNPNIARAQQQQQELQRQLSQQSRSRSPVGGYEQWNPMTTHAYAQPATTSSSAALPPVQHQQQEQQAQQYHYPRTRSPQLQQSPQQHQQQQYPIGNAFAQQQQQRSPYQQPMSRGGYR